jgi:hypothetical protein
MNPTTEFSKPEHTTDNGRSNLELVDAGDIPPGVIEGPTSDTSGTRSLSSTALPATPNNATYSAFTKKGKWTIVVLVSIASFFRSCDRPHSVFAEADSVYQSPDRKHILPCNTHYRPCIWEVHRAHQPDGHFVSIRSHVEKCSYSHTTSRYMVFQGICQ